MHYDNKSEKRESFKINFIKKSLVDGNLQYRSEIVYTKLFTCYTCRCLSVYVVGIEAILSASPTLLPGFRAFQLQDFLPEIFSIADIIFFIQ